MAMRTQMKKIGDTVVVSMDGTLDIENQEPLKQDLNRLLRQAPTDSTPRKIIFDLERLEFVGSSGISHFIQTMKDFHTRVPMKPRFCNVKSEFKRVMKAFDEQEVFEIHETQERARRSFDQ